MNELTITEMPVQWGFDLAHSAEEMQKAMFNMAQAVGQLKVDMSPFLDALEPHRVVRREALEIGVAPAIHEGWL